MAEFWASTGAIYRDMLLAEALVLLLFYNWFLMCKIHVRAADSGNLPSRVSARIVTST